MDQDPNLPANIDKNLVTNLISTLLKNTMQPQTVKYRF